MHLQENFNNASNRYLPSAVRFSLIAITKARKLLPAPATDRKLLLNRHPSQLSSHVPFPREAKFT